MLRKAGYYPSLGRLVVIFLTFAVVGCGGVQSTPSPPTEVRTVTIDRPVPTPCINASDIPAEPPKVGDQLTGNAGHDLDLVSASAIRLRVALEKTLALLGACVR